jgi:separase
MPEETLIRCAVALMSLEDDPETLKTFLSKLSDLARHHSDRADTSLLQAKIHLTSILAKMRMDPLMGLLPESSKFSESTPDLCLTFACTVLSIPMLGRLESSHRAAQVEEALHLLEGVEDNLVQTSLYRPHTSSVIHARDAFSALAAVRLLRATLIAPCNTHASSIAAALQAGVSMALRREMLDSVNSKLRCGIIHDDLRWPSSAVVENAREHTLHATRDRYVSESSGKACGNPQIGLPLPAEWSVLSLHLSQDCRSILAVRYGQSGSPVVYQLPLDRLGRRESDENLLTFEVANAELVEIVKQSNESAQAAKDMKTSEDRKAWWKLRKELEARLHDLLTNVEDRWFGMLRVRPDPVHLRMRLTLAAAYPVSSSQDA